MTDTEHLQMHNNNPRQTRYSFALKEETQHCNFSNKDSIIYYTQNTSSSIYYLINITIVCESTKTQRTMTRTQHGGSSGISSAS